MATPKSKDTPRITSEEYLERERASIDQKHEYVDGEIFAMVGASWEHNVINHNVSRLIGVYLEGKPCRVVSNDIKVRSKLNNSFFYPDTVIVCGQPEFYDERRDIIINPKIIIEVLSPSTEVYDRGEKSFHYQGIESLTEYILISQGKPRTESFIKYEENDWHYRVAHGTESNLTIRSIDFTVSLSKIYDGISF